MLCSLGIVRAGRPSARLAAAAARRGTAAAAYFSTSRIRMSNRLRIGFVPEHFSTPLHFAQTRFGLDADLIEYKSGTGHMVQSFKSNDIDVGIGLTEGWVAGLGKEQVSSSQSPLPYRIVGTYVSTPLCWAISTGSKRSEISSVDDLNGKKIGVSRIGSGSYVMGFVLADQEGWLSDKDGEPFEEFVVLNDFKQLREGVNAGKVDFFMWEHFTSKRYYDNGEIKRIGEIYTPWSSWKIVASPSVTSSQLDRLFESVNKGIKHFNEHPDEAVQYISTSLDYSREDATAWLDTVKFPNDVTGVDESVIGKTVDILSKAGVLDASKVNARDMVAISRK
ncbi:uncharacterized protein PV09_01925 [Verruconis gallopava]|uniref:Ca3427-like PBP 2 domain-containing protein n=1 Tax=Verruconis gallopava TaxID=253628 RepID=A0A0D1XWC8_9PEZI|nr:uncharacterized protein PV09_01925 [Verruconis gallopava]KIW07031.1 hypothetical protein PV09_01925 [Verruconis gallopava]